MKPKKVKIERDRHILDASQEAVGRLAVKAAVWLRGKHKVNYAPNIDIGDFVEVVNADKLIFTGNKIAQKKYFHSTGYIGNLKIKTVKELIVNNPAWILRRAITGMLPRNKLRKFWLRRLIIK